MRVAASVALVGVGVVAGRGMTFGQSLITSIQQVVSDSTGGSSIHIGEKPFNSPAAARKTLVRAQTEYQTAAAYLAASDSSAPRTGSPSLYWDRLAGLDEVTTASLVALKDAPRDPLLNQYFLSAAAAREATIQQLGNSLPVGATMERF
jgi:erythromycin esterase-like protein